MLMRRCIHPSMEALSLCKSTVHPWRSTRPSIIFIPTATVLTPSSSLLLCSALRSTNLPLSFCSDSQSSSDSSKQILGGNALTYQVTLTNKSPLKPGLYLVGTPIGNLEDITLRALRVLSSADIILSEDTRHSGKLLQHYNIKTPLLSYHKFNESQREHTVLKKLREGDIVAQISDAGTPGISDPGMELAEVFKLRGTASLVTVDMVKLCVAENIPVIPVPGPSALLAGLSASGLATDEFSFVGFLPKHAGSRRERLIASSNETTTQIFFVPPHKLCQFIEEAVSPFGEQRHCVIAREMTKIHEEFWRGTLGEAKEAFSTRQPKGEITFLIEGKATKMVEWPSESQLENELRELISRGHSLSTAIKLVAEGTSVRRKVVYSLALRKFGKDLDAEED